VKSDVEGKSIDVIIPIYKPDERLQRIIRRLLMQSRKVNEIILLQTLDEHERIAKFKEPNITVLPVQKNEFDHGLTRKFGAEHSDADILVFMTQDAVPKDKNMLKELVDPIERDNSVAMSYARQIPSDHADIIEAYTREFNYPDKDCIKSSEDITKLGIKTYFVSNSCAAYEKGIYEKLGGFEREIFAEDMMFAIKAVNSGYKIAYTARAQVIHSHNDTLKTVFQRNFDIGVLHKLHESIFAHLKSESEGLKMVKTITVRLLKRGNILKMFYFIAGCGAKFLGYQLGKGYDILPPKLTNRFTLNKEYWYHNS